MKTYIVFYRDDSVADDEPSLFFYVEAENEAQAMAYAPSHVIVTTVYESRFED